MWHAIRLFFLLLASTTLSSGKHTSCKIQKITELHPLSPFLTSQVRMIVGSGQYSTNTLINVSIITALGEPAELSGVVLYSEGVSGSGTGVFLTSDHFARGCESSVSRLSATLEP